jgi:hypothetical protein
MKTRVHFFICAALTLPLMSTLDSQLATAFAQGSLSPPGPPAPMMKTLAQIEPRTPISSAPFTISDPGSYYLTTNITVSSGDAIIIATNGVTLDLNGFTISSTAPSAAGYGILLNSGLRNITIANGLIEGGVTNGVYAGSGFGYGIEYSSFPPPVNVLVSRVSVFGCQYDGIGLGGIGNSIVVESCTVGSVGSYGIYASTVKNSTAIDCGGDAISGGQVSDCRGESSGGGGVSAMTALNCYGSSGGSAAGVNADTALNCRGYSCSGNGVVATSAQNCYGYSSSGTGVYVTSAQNCYGYSYSHGHGLSATTADSSYGYSYGNGHGVIADTALNCRGYSIGLGVGVWGFDAQNCYGQSGDGIGVLSHLATGSYGSSNSGTGLIAFIANTRSGDSTSGIALSITHNVNSY